MGPLLGVLAVKGNLRLRDIQVIYEASYSHCLVVGKRVTPLFYDTKSRKVPITVTCCSSYDSRVV